MDAKQLTEQRGSVYGHPLDDFGRAARLKAVVAAIEDPELRHAAEMICMKLARLCNTPGHLDSWDDIAGYARCGRMVIEERERRAIHTPPAGVVYTGDGSLGKMTFVEAVQAVSEIHKFGGLS